MVQEGIDPASSMDGYNLLHVIRLHGPLITYSTFPFESFNRYILKAIHGTNQGEQSICDAIPLYQHLHIRLRKVRDQGNRWDVASLGSKVIS